jgi:hypothetical protein
MKMRSTFHFSSCVHRLLEFQLSGITDPDSKAHLQTLAVHASSMQAPCKLLYIDDSTCASRVLLGKLVPVSQLSSFP